MKAAKILMVVAFLFALLGVASPASAIVYSYTSGYQVQNLSSDQAQITIDYYQQQTGSGTGGTVTTSVSDTIDGLKSKTYFPVHAPNDFKGSVVISSNVPLASIVNLVANGIGNASYVGSSQGSTTVFMPLLMKGNSGITTWYSVQNTGQSDATVTISYSDNTTAGPIVIKSGASYVFDQGAENHTKAVFAGSLTSDQPVVVVVVQEGTRVKTILASSGFEGGETNAFMPLVNSNNSGYNTGIQLQNAGEQATEITLTYTPVQGYGTQCWEKRTVQAHSSETFALFAFAGVAPASVTNCTTARFVGGAQITENSANMPIVAVVNQTTDTIAGAYDSFVPSKTTDKVVLPLIMDRNSGWYTGFTLANVGNDPVHVSCVFSNTSYQLSSDLAKGGVLLDIQVNKIANGYVGSGTCTATGSGEKKIVAVVNEIAPGSGDGLLTYEGINISQPQ